MFDSIFSFLKRKTDFYHIQLPGDKIGQCLNTNRRMICQCLTQIPE